MRSTIGLTRGLLDTGSMWRASCRCQTSFRVKLRSSAVLPQSDQLPAAVLADIGSRAKVITFMSSKVTFNEYSLLWLREHLLEVENDLLQPSVSQTYGDSRPMAQRLDQQ